MHASPKPLTRQRLEQLLRGLRDRMGRSGERLSAEMGLLADRIETLAVQHRRDLEQLQRTQQIQGEASLSEWDEDLHRGWGEAEQQVYQAVLRATEGEHKLRQEARARAAEITAEGKTRGAAIEKRFLKAKDVPLAELKNFRARNDELGERLSAIEKAAEAALTRRSLQVPSAAAPSVARPQPAHSTAALQGLLTAVNEAQAACERLANHRLAKFFGSTSWWILCGLLFGLLAAGLTVAGLLPLLTAVLVAAATTAVVLLLSQIGIRPWLKRFAAAEYPQVMMHAQLGRLYHAAGKQLAIEENDSELKRLAGKRDERLRQVNEWRKQQMQDIAHKLETELDEWHKRLQAEKQLASEQLSHSLAQTQEVFNERLQREQSEARSCLQKLNRESSTQRAELQEQIESLRLGRAVRLQQAKDTVVRRVVNSQRWCRENFPPWENLSGQGANWPAALDEPVFPLAQVPLAGLLPPESAAEAMPLLDADEFEAPLLYSPLEDGYLVINGDPHAGPCGLLVRNLLLRALTALPAGKTQLCVIDPSGLGSDYGWLMHLGDFDPQLVSHRVWTQPGHIAQQLSQLAMAAEDFIQQALRNQYRTIVEYNREAGALAEPYRFLVWSSFPNGLEEASWKSLLSLLESGARCGIISILIVDPKSSWPTEDVRQRVDGGGLHVTWDATEERLIARAEAIAQCPLRLTDCPDDETARQVVHEVGRRAVLAHRVEVPLAGMLPPEEERWQGDSSLALSIPIGQSGVGRTHCLTLGLGTAQHAIIAGKTGSGKSSLLHAIISSAALKYSPQRLRLVLLDFKKGVEFQVYSDARLPHADIIGIESHREFGLSALEFVDGCMQRRGEMFRQGGVQDLASWNAMHPQQVLPRMLIVIDEFQEMFIEDDKLSGQASLLLDRIVRQGRSFGIHAVLSSQTLAGAYSLPRTTLGQMSVRVALQCDPSDAQIIFSDDNPAAARLKHPGQAVYNDAGGRIEGNQPLQVGWLAKSQQLEWLQQLPDGYQNDDATTNRLGRCVVYDGNRAATWNVANADLALKQSRDEINPQAIWCVVGESVAISPAVTFPLTSQPGRHLLLVGSDDAQAAAVLNVVTASLIKETRGRGSRVVVLQGAKPSDAEALKLPALWGKFDCELHVADSRGAEKTLSELHQLLQQRVEGSGPSEGEGTGSEQPPVVLLHLLQLGRLRALRRSDEFGLGGFGDTELTPDKQLEELLRDGPSHGIHLAIWAESYSTVQRWLSRAALREMEIRLLMQMSASDSSNLMDSVAASRLGEHLMLVYDEATGQEQKFRPFANETLQDLASWTGTA